MRGSTKSFPAIFIAGLAGLLLLGVIASDSAEAQMGSLDTPGCITLGGVCIEDSDCCAKNYCSKGSGLCTYRFPKPKPKPKKATTTNTDGDQSSSDNILQIFKKALDTNTDATLTAPATEVQPVVGTEDDEDATEAAPVTANGYEVTPEIWQKISGRGGLTVWDLRMNSNNLEFAYPKGFYNCSLIISDPIGFVHAGDYFNDGNLSWGAGVQCDVGSVEAFGVVMVFEKVTGVSESDYLDFHNHCKQFEPHFMYSQDLFPEQQGQLYMCGKFKEKPEPLELPSEPLEMKVE